MSEGTRSTAPLTSVADGAAIEDPEGTQGMQGNPWDIRVPMAIFKDFQVLKGASQKWCIPGDPRAAEACRGVQRRAEGGSSLVPSAQGGGDIRCTPAGQLSKIVRIVRLEEDARNFLGISLTESLSSLSK